MQTSVESTETTRRGFIKGVGGALAVSAVRPEWAAADGGLTPGLAIAGRPVAVSDRGVGLRQQLSIFGLARQCGLTAVELDLGRLGAASGMHNRLLDPAVRGQFIDAAETAGVGISALALSAFDDQSFARHPKAPAYADDLLYLMRDMRVPVGLLPIDADDDYTRGLTVERLRPVAAAAEAAGVVIALDSSPPAAALRDVLDAVDSPALRGVVRFGPGVDCATDLATIGIDRVAQIRYRHDSDADASAELANVVRQVSFAGWQGRFVIERPAVILGDAAGDLALAADRMRGLFSPTLT